MNNLLGKSSFFISSARMVQDDFWLSINIDFNFVDAPEGVIEVVWLAMVSGSNFSGSTRPTFSLRNFYYRVN